MRAALNSWRRINLLDAAAFEIAARADARRMPTDHVGPALARNCRARRPRRRPGVLAIGDLQDLVALRRREDRRLTNVPGPWGRPEMF
jgi:hypothetical protein